jgi:hypothetical protein
MEAINENSSSIEFIGMTVITKKNSSISAILLH